MGLYSAKPAGCAVAGVLLFLVAGCGSAGTPRSALPPAPITTAVPPAPITTAVPPGPVTTAVPAGPVTTTVPAGPALGPAALPGSASVTSPEGFPSTPTAGPAPAGAAASGVASAGAANSTSRTPASGASAPPPPGSLAPAGPAPGGYSSAEEDAFGEQPIAARLADSVGCADLEVQEHLPAVSEQVSCRRGIDRVYVLTFVSPANRDTYLSAVRPVVPGGWNVIGPSWVLHVETQSLATGIQQQIGGSTHPAA